MTPPKNNPAPATADREIVISRVVDAPRELVWEAWTNPEHVAKWWGPRGFSTTIEKMDFSPGGVWKHVMRGPDGVEYPNQSKFIEIVKPERIRYSHGGGTKGKQGVRFESTWTFETVEDGKTRVTIRHVFPSVEDRDRVVRDYGAAEGAKQTLERLLELLPSLSAAAEFVISRTFDAPRELVWKAWTEPERLKQWWGPRVIKTPICEMNVRVGGKYRMVMRAPDGQDYPMCGVFKEIVEPSRLVMTMDCSEHPPVWHDMVDPNRQGNPNPAGEMLMTVTFTEVGGKTTVDVHVRMVSTAIRDNMVRIGMSQGWSESLDRLTELLANG
jgi:uncharacterized protein YndB with AHSA1/START domain